MKNSWFLLVGLLFVNPAQAQLSQRAGDTYRVFQSTFNLFTGEQKSATLKVNSTLRVDRHGDPEIESHGFNDYVITGIVEEAGKTCNFELLLTQANGEAINTAQVLASNTDRSGGIKLCSGLILGITSFRALLVGSDTAANLRTPGLANPIGTSTLKFLELKTVAEAPYCPDPWHSPCGNNLR
jgi:hypothetical protein